MKPCAVALLVTGAVAMLSGCQATLPPLTEVSHSAVGHVKLSIRGWNVPRTLLSNITIDSTVVQDWTITLLTGDDRVIGSAGFRTGFDSYHDLDLDALHTTKSALTHLRKIRLSYTGGGVLEEAYSRIINIRFGPYFAPIVTEE